MTCMGLTITKCGVCNGDLNSVVTVEGDGDIPTVTCSSCTDDQSWSN